jgi:hypothetical protein
MSRRNHNGSIPQRSKRPANKGERRRRSDNAFTLYRPVSAEAVETVYERLRRLQQEDDIPKKVQLFQHELHSSLIQERRMRRFAQGLAIATRIMPHLLHSNLPDVAKDTIPEAKITQTQMIGRNRNTLIARINDEEGRLHEDFAMMNDFFQQDGIKNPMLDKGAHITLGSTRKGEVVTQTERRHVEHTVVETLGDIAIDLGPLWIEYKGLAQPLSDFIHRQG